MRTRRLPHVPLVTLMALLAGGLQAAPRDDLRFARDGHARVPFDLRNQHVWVRGAVNGDSAWIVVDTGASSSVLDDSLARRLGLAVVGEQESRGAGGFQQGRIVADVTVELPGLTLRRSRMGALDLAGVSARGGRTMELVLGYELFRDCVVRFDYAARMMDVWDARRAPPDPPEAAVVPITLIRNHPHVEGELTVPGRPPFRGRYVIDTGSAGSLILTPEIARTERLADVFPRTIVAIARGIGGEVRHRIGRATSFTLGGLRFAAPLVSVPDSSGGQIASKGSTGNIGGQILGRCRVTFDYGRKRMLLEPAEGFARPFEADMSGAALVRGAEGYEVRWVQEQSPASEADLRIGDIVTGVDGEPAARVDPALLRERMREEGRVVRLTVRRGEASHEVAITLRRLI